MNFPAQGVIAWQSLDLPAVCRLLPHRPPFLFVDRAEVDLVGGQSRTWHLFRSDEPYFEGHFPNNPIVPGVVLLECMAQAGRLLLNARAGGIQIGFLVGLDTAKFNQTVRPGDLLRVETRLVRSTGEMAVGIREGEIHSFKCAGLSASALLHLHVLLASEVLRRGELPPVGPGFAPRRLARLGPLLVLHPALGGECPAIFQLSRTSHVASCPGRRVPCRTGGSDWSGGMSGLIRHLVAYADTDAGGVMYHGRYVELAERSRLVALHQAGWSMARLQTALRLYLVVHRLDVRFRRPARLEQWLEASTQLRQGSEARCVMRTRIEHAGDLLATLDVELVALADLQLTRIPSVLLRDLRQAIPGQGPAPMDAIAETSLHLVP